MFSDFQLIWLLILSLVTFANTILSFLILKFLTVAIVNIESEGERLSLRLLDFAVAACRDELRRLHYLLDRILFHLLNLVSIIFNLNTNIGLADERNKFHYLIKLLSLLITFPLRVLVEWTEELAETAPLSPLNH